MHFSFAAIKLHGIFDGISYERKSFVLAKTKEREREKGREKRRVFGKIFSIIY